MDMVQTSPTAQVMMSRDEAEMLHKRIVARDKMQARDLKSMYELEGWKALGYGSWDDYLHGAFDYSAGYLSRLNSQVQINYQLAGNLPERQTRALKKLDGVEKRKEAYQTAKRLADAEGGDLSLRHVEMGVKQVSMKEQVHGSKHRVVSVMMDAGDISPVGAVKMIDALDKLDDVTYGKVITIVAEHGLSDAQLILPFADMVNRESRTLARILATGHINNQPIGSASLADLKVEKAFSQTEIIGDKVEKKRKDAVEQGQVAIIAYVVTVYENDPVRTLKALAGVLKESDLVSLREMI